MTARVRFASGLRHDKRLVERATAAVHREVGYFNGWYVLEKDERRACEGAAIRVLALVDRRLARAKARKRKRAGKGK